MAKYKVPTTQELIDAGVHFGHQARRWHPKMEPYIYSVNRNVHIIDLEQTEKLLKTACEFLFEKAKKGLPVVFIGTKRQSGDIIELEAKRCGAMYVRERWIGGTITNFKTIKRNLDKLIDLMKGRDNGRFEKYNKRERLEIDREIEKMLKAYGGFINMQGVPGALFIIDPKREKTAVHEAKISGIPIVALVDTNADPSDIDYVIPGNDDSIRSVAIIVKAVSDAVEEGYKEYAKIGEKSAEAITTPGTKEEVQVKITVDEGHLEKIEKEVEKEVEKVVEEVKEKAKVVSEPEIKEIKKRGRPKKES